MKLNADVDVSSIVNNAKMRIAHPSIRNSNDIVIIESIIANLEKADIPQQGEFYVQTAFLSIYSKVTSELKMMFRQLDTIKDFYIVKVIIEQIIEDALSPAVGTEQIFKYSHKDPDIQKDLDLLQNKKKLDALVRNTAADLIFYGHYPIRLKLDEGGTISAENSLTGKEARKKSRGILMIKDEVDIGALVKIPLGDDDYAFLHLEETTGQIDYHDKNDFVMFTLDGGRIRARTDLWAVHLFKGFDKQAKEYLDKIPKYIRIGRPFFYGMIDKIKELELLEKLVPAVKLNKLTQGNLLSLQLPNDYSLKEGTIAANQMEQLINKKISVDPDTKQLSVEAILASAGRTRVIPQFGDKGTLNKNETKAEEVDDIASTSSEMKVSLLDSVGVPSELVYKSDGLQKSEILKRYAKYVRKLKAVQRAYADGLKTIGAIHLKAKGIEVREDDIEVQFLNALIEVDNLDQLEFAQAAVNTVKEIADVFVNVLGGPDSPFREQIDFDKLGEWMEQKLKFVGLSDIIKTKKEGGKAAIKPMQAGVDPNADTPSEDENVKDNSEVGADNDPDEQELSPEDLEA